MGIALSTVHLYRNSSLHNPVPKANNNIEELKEKIKLETGTVQK